MKISTAFKGSYLKVADLGGEEKTYTIKSVKLEAVGQGKDAEEKPVLRFNEVDQGLVLNKTNASTISDELGDDTDDWVGCNITLRPAKTEFNGKRVDCIRVSVPEGDAEFA